MMVDVTGPQVLLASAGLAKVFPHLRRELTEACVASKHGFTVTVEPLQPKQTDSQRGYYHLWKNNFAAFTGNTPDEMHEHLLCEAYGSDFVNTRLGYMRRPMKRSSEADRIDYSVLIDTLIRVAAEMGFSIPPPIKPR